MSYPKLSDKKCKNCAQFIFMKRKRDEIKEFCGRKCASIFLKSNKETRACLTCNAGFQTIPSHDYHYCSQQCANRSRIKIHIRVCERCGDKFELDNIAYEKRGGGKFCSRECATRIYNFDENYFQDINTSEKAYWLGMLLSDGNVYKTQMTLKLQRRDRYLLERFKLSLSSEHPIHDDISAEGHEFSSFFIGSKKLSQQLKSLGVIPNKTFNVKFPKLEKQFISHFIRGYFDGDGCMYNNKRHHIWSIYSASKSFVKDLFTILKKETNLHFNKYNETTISLSRKNDLIELEKYLYSEATIFLPRKRIKIIEAIS